MDWTQTTNTIDYGVKEINEMENKHKDMVEFKNKVLLLLKTVRQDYNIFILNFDSALIDNVKLFNDIFKNLENL